MNAWICPKCGKVWGPLVMQCALCNTGPISATNTHPSNWPPLDGTNAPPPKRGRTYSFTDSSTALPL